MYKVWLHVLGNREKNKIFILFQAYSFSVSSTAVGGKNQQFSVKY